MKIIILTVIIFCNVFKVNCQVLNGETVKALEEYFFIPVQFDNFGKWIAEIEKDSSLIISNKKFYLENDSMYLNLHIQKPGFQSHFKSGEPSITILALTRSSRGTTSIHKNINGLKFETGQPFKINYLTLILTIPFDSTDAGKQLAAQAQVALKDQFNSHFKFRRIIKPKKAGKRVHHKEIEQFVSFRLTDNGYPISSIFHTFQENQNQVVFNIFYQLIN